MQISILTIYLVTIFDYLLSISLSVRLVLQTQLLESVCFWKKLDFDLRFKPSEVNEYAACSVSVLYG